MRSKSLEEMRNSNEESDKDSNETVNAVKNEVLYKKEAEDQSKETAIGNKKPPPNSRSTLISSIGREKRSLAEQLGNLAGLSAELANLNKVIEELKKLTAGAEEKTRKQLEVNIKKKHCFLTFLFKYTKLTYN